MCFLYSYGLFFRRRHLFHFARFSLAILPILCRKYLENETGDHPVFFTFLKVYIILYNQTNLQQNDIANSFNLERR